MDKCSPGSADTAPRVTHYRARHPVPDRTPYGYGTSAVINDAPPQITTSRQRGSLPPSLRLPVTYLAAGYHTTGRPPPSSDIPFNAAATTWTVGLAAARRLDFSAARHAAARSPRRARPANSAPVIMHPWYAPVTSPPESAASHGGVIRHDPQDNVGTSFSRETT